MKGEDYMEKAGLYVHIPFCLSKCAYCDFTSFAETDEVKEKYTDSLSLELEKISQHTGNVVFDSIYFGGGTPSVLPPDLSYRLMYDITRLFNIDENAEITTECNPKTLTLEKAKLYKKFFNRVSLGVQSLSDKSLELISRSHRLIDFYESYAALKIAGFENISYDLMFSLPGQSFEDFKFDLEKIMLFRPAHLSIYSLTLEENTPLYENRDKFIFPSDGENRKMYHYTKDFLERNGFKRYEVSNYAKEGFESGHNLKYWSMQPYIGAGCAAASFFNSVRHTNPCSLEEYFNYCKNDNCFPFENEKREEKESLESDFMFLGLRKTEGICDSDFIKMFGESFMEKYKYQIEKHINNKLLAKKDGRIFLTERGFDLANEVMCDFV